MITFVVQSSQTVDRFVIGTRNDLMTNQLEYEERTMMMGSCDKTVMCRKCRGGGEGRKGGDERKGK